MLGWDEKNEAHSRQLVAREAEYPPTDILEDDSPFTRMAEEYGAEQLVYAHSHGESRFYDSIHGEKNGVFYRLASGDYLNWKPVRLL